MLDVLKTMSNPNICERDQNKTDDNCMSATYTIVSIFSLSEYMNESCRKPRDSEITCLRIHRALYYIFFLVVLSWSERRCKWDRQTHFLLYFSYQNSFTVPLQLVWSSCHWSHKGIGRAFLEHPSQYVSIVNVFKRDSELNSGDECLKNHKILRQFYKFIQ